MNTYFVYCHIGRLCKIHICLFINEVILLIMISAHVANYVRSIQGEGLAEYCDRAGIKFVPVLLPWT